MRFKEFLQEAVQLADIDFSQFQKIGGMIFKYDFVMGSRTYSVAFEQQDPADNVWERFMTYHSKSGRSYAATNFHLDVYKILGVQFGCLKAFLTGYSPNVVMFTADKADRSRANVYEGVLKRMNLQTLGYKYRSVDENSDIRFFVEKI